MWLVADDDLMARHAHLDMYVEHVAGAMPPVQLLDRNAAADHVVVEAVELLDTLADLGLDRRRGGHVVKDDFDRDFHRAPPLSNAGSPRPVRSAAIACGPPA